MRDHTYEAHERKLLAEYFWSDRWMGSSAFLLPLEPRGLYREMLTQAWRRGARLPNDPEAIMRSVGCTADEWARCWPQIAPYWRVEGDSLVNETQQQVYAESLARLDARSAASRKANAARWSGRNPNGVRTDVKPDKPATTRGQAFVGKRIRVPTFLHDEFVRLLGRMEFDLHGWYPQLDAELEQSGDPIGDEIAYVRQRFYAASNIPKPNLFGREERRRTCDGGHNPACASPQACYEKQQQGRAS